jgi:hypothetical protein
MVSRSIAGLTSLERVDCAIDSAPDPGPEPGLGGSSPAGSKHSMVRMLGEGAGAQRTRTRMPVCTVPSTACSRHVSAPSRRMNAHANGRSSGWPSSGDGSQHQVTTVPSRATSTSSSGAICVTGSYSNGGTCTRPSAARAPRIRCSASPARNRLSTGPGDRV